MDIVSWYISEHHPARTPEQRAELKLAPRAESMRALLTDYLQLDDRRHVVWHDWFMRLPYTYTYILYDGSRVTVPERGEVSLDGVRVIKEGSCGGRFFRTHWFWADWEQVDVCRSYERNITGWLPTPPWQAMQWALDVAWRRLDYEARATLKFCNERGLTPMARATGKKAQAKTGKASTVIAKAAELEKDILKVYPENRTRLALVTTITERIMKEPHIKDIDWLGAREVARLTVQLEELDAMGAVHRDASYGHLRSRLSRRLEEWLADLGLTPAARARILRLQGGQK